MDTKQTIIAIVVIATAVVIADGMPLGSSVWQNPPPQVAPGAADPAERSAQLARLATNPNIAPDLLRLLQDLHSDLQAQREAHEDLQTQLVQLRQERLALAGLAQIQATGDAETTPAESPNNRGRTALDQFRRRRGTVSEARLVAAGFAADQAREIVSQADAITMQRLNMQYQATREGWIDTEQYRQALGDLPDVREIVTSEYGDDAYDRYLYASGRPNRLVVRDVLLDSPAGVAGLQPGDRVLAMADERIYSTRDLMNIASTGRAGETVSLVVERGDTIFELYVPRGPLGIRGDRGFENPASHGATL